MAQTVFKWCKDAIHRFIFRNRSQISEQERLLVVYMGMLWRTRERQERELAGPNETRRKILNVAPEEIPPRLKTSKTSPFNIDRSDRCFFCDGSESRGKALLLLLPSPYVQNFQQSQRST